MDGQELREQLEARNRGHYLGRTRNECIAAGQSTICEHCKAIMRGELPEEEDVRADEEAK